MIRLAAASLLLVAQPLAAQEVMPCDWQARADAIVEPWEENTRTFANGDVRVALLDVAEPASAAYYLLVLAPPVDELGLRGCSVIGFAEGLGYAFLDFDTLTADYDPATGLVLQIIGQIYLPEESFTNSTRLSVAINQASGEIAVSAELGRE